MKKVYFNQLAVNHNILKVEENLRSTSQKNKVKFISLISLTCNQELKICEFLGENSKEEIFRDYGRFSKEGFSFLNKKFQEIDIFND